MERRDRRRDLPNRCPRVSQVLCNSVINLGPLLADFGVITAIRRKLWVTLVSLWCDFGSTLKSLWGHFGHIDGECMYDVYSCGFDGVIVRPKRAHKQEIHIFASFFACQKSHGQSKICCKPMSPGVWEGVGGGETLPLGDWFGGFGRFGGP